MHGITPADKQSDRKETVRKSVIVEKSAKNITVTENANERSAAAQEPVEKSEPEVREASSCGTAPPPPPATTAIPELQSNEVVDLDASATR